MQASLRESFGSYLNIVGAATTTVKAGQGALIGIVVNKPVNADTITLWDNTAASGTKIGTITISGTVPLFLKFDCKFSNGLTVVTSGADDITIIYC
jgi:hypothetical protein